MLPSAFRSHRLCCRDSPEDKGLFPTANGSNSARPLSVRAQDSLLFLVCDWHKKASSICWPFFILQTSQESKWQGGLWLAATQHPAPTQWVTMPRPHCPVSYSGEAAPPTQNKAAPMVGGGREKNCIFYLLQGLTAWTVASKEQTLFSGRWTDLSFK